MRVSHAPCRRDLSCWFLSDPSCSFAAVLESVTMLASCHKYQTQMELELVLFGTVLRIGSWHMVAVT